MCFKLLLRTFLATAALASFSTAIADEATSSTNWHTGFDVKNVSVSKPGADQVTVHVSVINKNKLHSIQMCGVMHSKDEITRSTSCKPATVLPQENQIVEFQITRPSGWVEQTTDYIEISAIKKDGTVLIKTDYPLAYKWPILNWGAVQPSDLEPARASSFISAIKEKKYAAVESVVEKWSNPETGIDESGDWPLRQAFNIMTRPANKEAADESMKLIKDWQAAVPTSMSAKLADAMYQISMAEATLRVIQANKKHDPALEKNRIEFSKASEVLLIETREVADRNPLWYEIALRVMINQKKGDKPILQFYDEAIKKHPAYTSLGRIMIDYYTSSRATAKLDMVEYVASKTLEHTKNKYGNMMYADIYSYAAFSNSDWGLSIFRETGVLWDKVASGFIDLAKKGKSPRVYNKYAAMACHARDANTFNKIFPLISRHIMPEYWVGAFSVEQCIKRSSQPIS